MDWEEVRSQKDWTKADVLRDQVAALGWQIQDSPESSALVRGDEQRSEK